MQVSERLMQLVFDAVEQGLKPLQARNPFVPFVLTITPEGVVMRRYDTDSNAAALAEIRDSLRDTSDIYAYALAFDATLTVDDTEYDAIVIEAAEKGDAAGWRFAQRYQPPTATQPVQTIGDVALMGQIDSYFRTNDPGT